MSGECSDCFSPICLCDDIKKENTIIVDGKEYVVDWHSQIDWNQDQYGSDGVLIRKKFVDPIDSLREEIAELRKEITELKEVISANNG